MGPAMRRSFTSSRLAGAIVVIALALFAPAASASSDSGPEGSALRVLGHTVLAAIGTGGANHAVDALGNSLALLGARYRIENGETGGGAGSAQASADNPAPPVDEVV